MQRKLACRFFSSRPALSVCAAWPDWSYHPEADVLQEKEKVWNSFFHCRLTDEQDKTCDLCGKQTKQEMTTSSISEHHFLVIHQPTKAGELQVVSRWGLDSDVPAVPVVLHPVLLLLNLHQDDITQVLPNSHLIGVHLKRGQHLPSKVNAENWQFIIKWGKKKFLSI